MATIDITKETIEDTIANNDIVIIDFWAPWCGPCKSFAPTYETVSEKYDDVIFGKVNTEDQQELGANFQIRSIPTLMVFREQIAIFSQAGALPESALEEVIAKVKALDMDQVRKDVAEQQENSQV
jgi:thioredoxin 1